MSVEYEDNPFGDLLPCPFCGEDGKTDIREKTFWTGMRSVPISYELRHWCKKDEGYPLPSPSIVYRAPERERVVAWWNTRKDYKAQDVGGEPCL